MSLIFTVGKAEFLIMKEPGKKRQGIYLLDPPNTYIKIATFISDEAVNTFVDAANGEIWR